MTESDNFPATHQAQLAYYEDDGSLVILCQPCAERREQQGQTCQWFDTIGDIGQLIDLIQCEDCNALPCHLELAPGIRCSICGDVGLDEDEYMPIYDSIQRHSPEWYEAE